MKLISVDGGTTNTRLTLLTDGEVIDVIKIHIGAGSAVSDKENAYLKPLREGVAKLLKDNHLKETDISAVIFSGMICSEAGLRSVPHIPAPADAAKVALSAQKDTAITDIPTLFLPGIRTAGEDPLAVDIMRGEETELFGIYARTGAENFVAVMPGSHTKIVRMTDGGTVETFRTALTGELIRSVADHTILKTGISGVFPKIADRESLREGYDCCAERGLNQALFKVRILQLFSQKTQEQLYAFLVGACMYGDVQCVLEYAGKAPVYVGGSDPFRKAYLQLLEYAGCRQVSELPEDLAEHAAAYGAYAVFSHLQ